ncbi:hypothetical protein [Labilibaculum euxinus]
MSKNCSCGACDCSLRERKCSQNTSNVAYGNLNVDKGIVNKSNYIHTSGYFEILESRGK